ncbi:MAG: zinc-ribbon domain-containing protein [Clostridiales bacterium]|nr:zinc-ribbon domain-containing protein [Clostridiales bacterium]
MMFCQECGNKTSEIVRFCPECGSRIREDAGSFEKPQLVLSMSKKGKLFKEELCYLIFYNHKLICAFLSKEKIKIAREQKAKEVGKKFFQRIASALVFYEEYGERYYNLPENEIINEDPLNFELQYMHISKIKFVRPRGVHTSDNYYVERGKLEIIIQGAKLKYMHNHNDDDKRIKNILNRLLGGVLKYF